MIEADPPTLTKRQAQRLCQSLGRAEIIEPTRHFEEEVLKEGLTSPEALRVIRVGTVIREPRWDPMHRNHIVNIRGTTSLGQRMEIVIGVRDNKISLLVTIMKAPGGGRR